jgi:hypothetical protein
LITSTQYQEEEVINHVKNNNPLLGALEGLARPGDSSPVANRGAFEDLLRDHLRNEGTTESDPAHSLPLDKEKLAVLVKDIGIQMNRRLFNMVFRSGEDLNSASAIMPHYNPDFFQPGLEASKYRQTAPKNEFKSEGPILEAVIARAASKYDVDPDLIRSVIKAESNFDPQATSPKGAIGLMQLMPETAKDLGVRNAYDPEENIMGGTRYLKSLLDRYKGNIDLTLAAYNWGMGNVEKKSSQMPAETVNYVAVVNNYYKNMKV